MVAQQKMEINRENIIFYEAVWKFVLGELNCLHQNYNPFIRIPLKNLLLE